MGNRVVGRTEAPTRGKSRRQQLLPLPTSTAPALDPTKGSLSRYLEVSEILTVSVAARNSIKRKSKTRFSDIPGVGFFYVSDRTTNGFRAVDKGLASLARYLQV